MHTSQKPLAVRPVRHDGWTPQRRRQFLDALVATACVRAACARAGLSCQAAYKLRRRDPAFAQAWAAALQTAQRAAEDRFLAMLPEALRRALSDSPTAGELRALAAGTPRAEFARRGVAGNSAQDTVRFVKQA